MTDRTRDIALGFTTLLALAGLGWLLLVFGELKILEPERYLLRLRTADAGGITGTSEVRLNGVTVGRVLSAATEVDPRQGVILTLAIDEAVHIPTDVKVQIQQDFLGSTNLSLIATAPPKGEAGGEGFFKPGDEFQRDVRGQIDQLTALLTERLNEVADAAQGFKKLSETYIAIGERIENILEPRTTAEVDAGSAPANFTSTLARLDQAIASANSWLSPNAQTPDGSPTVIAQARSLLDRASEAVDAWTSTARSLESQANAMGTQGTEAMRSFSESTAQLNTLLADTRSLVQGVAQGKGTLGQLATNPDLYRSLNDAAIRLEQALRDARLLIEKFRVEGVPIQF